MRMTLVQREKIVKRAIKAAFDKETAALAKREDALARRCYAAIFPPKVRRAVASLPEAWFETTSKIRLNLCGKHIELDVSERLRVPHNGGWVRIGTLDNETLSEAVAALFADKKNLAERRARAEASAQAVVNSTTTFEKLREVWPEAEPHITDVEGTVEKKVPLPAAQISELNAMLGIKPRRKAA